MKNLIIFLLISGLISFVEVKSASAQVKLEEVTVYGKSTKAVVSDKVSKSFDRLFKDAVAPQWYEVSKRIVVNFIMNDKKNKAVFTKSGSLVYHLTYGSEADLPTDVRSIVKSKYFDYEITSAVNVDIDGRSIWVVNIEDAKQIFVLRVEDGSMDVIDKLSKTMG